MKKSEYEKARDKLIPKAEAKANEKVGAYPESLKVKMAWGFKWNKIFLDTMHKLSREAGLI